MDKEKKKKMNKHFPKEDIQMANKHMKKYFLISVIVEMKVKITMRYHCTFLGISQMKQ